MLKFSWTIIIILILISCSEDNNQDIQDDSLTPYISSSLSRYYFDPNIMVLDSVFLQWQQSKSNLKITDAEITIDDIVCDPVTISDNSIVYASMIDGGAGKEHTMRVLFDGITYTSNFIEPGEFVVTCPISAPSSSSLEIDYSYTGGIRGQKVSLWIPSSYTNNGVEYIAEITPDTNGTFIIPPGTLSIGNDRSIHITSTIYAPFENAMAGSQLSFKHTVSNTINIF